MFHDLIAQPISTMTLVTLLPTLFHLFSTNSELSFNRCQLPSVSLCLSLLFPSLIRGIFIVQKTHTD